jgi:hypothetical protein
LAASALKTVSLCSSRQSRKDTHVRGRLLLGQLFLFNHLEDCNYVCEAFLIVPTGVNRHDEVGRIGKLDLEDLRIFLGHDGV